VSAVVPQPGRRAFDPYAVGRGLVVALAVLIVIAMAVPALFVVPVSFSPTRFLTFPPPSFSLQWYESYFSTPEWTQSTVYSVVLAVLTTLVSLLIGIPAAFGLARGQFRGRGLVTLLIVAPLVVPVILIAIAEYFFMVEVGLIGTTAGLVIAHTLLALPFVVIIVTAALRGYDRSFERAAMSMGAGPLRTFWHVTLPLIRPSVISAALFAFLASFGEFLVSLFVIGATRSTLPIQLWKGIRFETNPTIAAAASMLVAISLAALLAVELARWQTRRRAESRPATLP
jgi:ABC-type spermidine/putrescine transport system permease subunit II